MTGEKNEISITIECKLFKINRDYCYDDRHVCDLIYPSFPAEAGAIGLHIVGRLTSLIMWFFVCERYYYTHNVKKVYGANGSFCHNFAFCFYPTNLHQTPKIIKKCYCEGKGNMV